MKILYISNGNGPDYLCDMAFSGLRSLFGEDVVDVNPLAYMYQGCPKENLYGRGFTLYGLLPHVTVDRTDIESKIAKKFYDLIIFGSIRRCSSYLGDALNAYPRDRILMIDGEDIPGYLNEYAKRGIYFKRELHSPQPNCLPIQFAIPEEKIQEPLPKKDFMAPLDPLNTKTYIYDDEQAYYDQYRRSLFGLTCKKAGWDCLRHYEILACGALPYFMDLADCPDTIMCHLPKKELMLAKNIIEYDGGTMFIKPWGGDLWADLYQKCQKVLREHLTTVALAKRILSEANHGKADFSYGNVESVPVAHDCA